MSFAADYIGCPEPMLCFYINRTHQTQVARFCPVSPKACDRIIRPNEHLLFEALPGANLEIYTLVSDHTTLINSFCCKDLKVSNELIENMLRWLS